MKEQEKADELIERFLKCELYDNHKAVLCAIICTQNTIDTLTRMFDEVDIANCTIIQKEINEQIKVKQILENK